MDLGISWPVLCKYIKQACLWSRIVFYAEKLPVTRRTEVCSATFTILRTYLDSLLLNAAVL